ncbi:MAG: MerR family transcriptional regulator [Anaerolineae bacterium]|nr:MerR family transcriptional regulator [Anaerolineae bacterium]MCB0199268.1 MerR family transcriptional regulator [Anaerolineae bacterium]MCB0203613.1 MerR family transcriptional regulator [Anaerolineae bacterium]
MTNDPSLASAGQSNLYRPAEVAQLLGISAATLRRWSNRFADFLVLNDGTSEGGSHRRYTSDDVAVLQRVQELLDQGLTYEQVAEQLTQDLVSTEPDDSDAVIIDNAEESVAGEDNVQDQELPPDSDEHLPAEVLPPAARFLQDAVKNLTDTQQIILNSQIASRDLMGVMIQDNLNLKGENTDLRERMLELERELGEQRRYHGDYRERMETRVRVLEDAVSKLMASQRSPTPPPQQPQQPYGSPPPTYPQQYQQPYAAPQQQERRSFWSRLIGG